jgi:hypothetical protein
MFGNYALMLDEPGYMSAPRVFWNKASALRAFEETGRWSDGEITLLQGLFERMSWGGVRQYGRAFRIAYLPAEYPPDYEYEYPDGFAEREAHKCVGLSIVDQVSFDIDLSLEQGDPLHYEAIY